MGNENKYEGLDAYAVRLIKHKARQLVGRAGFVEADRHDLEQDLVIDLIGRAVERPLKHAGFGVDLILPAAEGCRQRSSVAYDPTSRFRQQTARQAVGGHIRRRRSHHASRHR